jgi:hypothetical protein
MKILFIGDIVASPGRKKVCLQLPEIIEKENIFFTIAQGENCAGGIGITEKTAILMRRPVCYGLLIILKEFREEGILFMKKRIVRLVLLI